MRLPKSDDDLGDVMKEADNFQKAELFDGKHIYLQQFA